MTIASGQHGPYAVTVDATNVYWTTVGTKPEYVDGALWSCPLAGCGASGPFELIAAQLFPRGLSVFGGTVYWTNNGTTALGYIDGAVLSCPITGCAGSPTTIASNLYAPASVAVDATGVYWPDHVGGGIARCPINGCPGSPVPIVAGLIWPDGLILDSGDLFWFDLGTPPDYLDGTVAKCSAADCANTITQFATVTNPSSVAVDTGNVYWTSGGTGPTYSDGIAATCPRAGCGGNLPTVLASNQSQSLLIVVSGPSAYWTNRGAEPAHLDGSLMQCTITGCGSAPTQIAGGQGMFGLAVDGTSVYWTRYGALGYVMKTGR